MNRSDISIILHELNLNENSVANIYNYGSWVYGTNTPTSDRDLMIVTRSTDKDPLKFDPDFDYFHQFELHKLWNKYDVCIHSVENFEILLQKNYLLAIECIFLPNEFKIKEEIDFRPIYLEKYYDKFRLKQVAFYENLTAMNMFNANNNSSYYRKRSSRSSQSNKDYLFKNLFHGFRYLDFAEQLIQTRSIHDYKRVSHIFSEMKDIRGDPTDNSNIDIVFNLVDKLSIEYKAKLDTLVPTNIIKGTFEAHVTFDCSYNTEEIVEKLEKACENTKYKIIFIDSATQQLEGEHIQLITSSSYSGEYPSIVKQIEKEVHEHFKQFNIKRIKIKSLASNEGVPQTDIDKRLFWSKKTYYFEFHYKILVKKGRGENKLNKLRTICQSNRKFCLRASYNAFKQLDQKHFHYTVTTRLFDSDREKAFKSNDAIVEYLTKNNFPPLETVSEFIVYDTHIELDMQ
ncbi:unnamed protein product [Rotaria sp. Silwood1]|nr:unnamed protein product [Rotaria sp. Silwood1]CAF3489548.1 unnamed protein product [Rotaria sp. Silwood1]CAF4960868.1 unnamed protein product [Rotaria sp. Silwood1]